MSHYDLAVDKIDRLARGDLILFTGLNRVQAIGSVGCKLRNQALADALWRPDPDTGGWSNVYTVTDFRLVTGLGYSAIQVLAGYRQGDVFQETRVTSADQAAALIQGLGLAADTPVPTDQDAQARRGSSPGLGWRLRDRRC